MTAVDFITLLFCRVDDELGRLLQHEQGYLHPNEIVTLGLLYTLKGKGQRAFYRFESHLCYTMALFNLLTEFHRLEPDNDGFVQLSIVEFDIL